MNEIIMAKIKMVKHYKEFAYEWLGFRLGFSHKRHMQLQNPLVTLDKSHKILVPKDMTWQ
jgi:hypothetical protein